MRCRRCKVQNRLVSISQAKGRRINVQPHIQGQMILSFFLFIFPCMVSIGSGHPVSARKDVFLCGCNQSATQHIDDFVWGVPLMVFILSGGILLTAAHQVFLQIRICPLALKWMVKNEEGGTGEVSSFGALCTALSATIGTGNIVGVATAVCAGGPGAIFWMIVAAFFGMATKYAEGFLAVKYRIVDRRFPCPWRTFLLYRAGHGAPF